MTTTDFFLPRSVTEALDLLRQHDDVLLMGGGTVMMALINDGILFPRKAMSLRRAGLEGIHSVNNHVEIGAMATLAQVAQLADFPTLVEAANGIGGPAVRTMATLGGNLFARPPYGDMTVPLLALDATVEVAGVQGRRIIPLDEFLGAQPTSGEIVTAIHVPRAAGQHAYLKYGRRQANTPAVVAVTVRVVTDANGNCTESRIALGAAGPHAFRAEQAESLLMGNPLNDASIAAAAEAAMNECDPFTDAIASEWYRRKMVGVYTRRALAQAMAGEQQ